MLGPEGLLPPGRHTVDVDRVRQVFADGFPSSQTRRPLFDAWVQHRQAFTVVLPILSQWLDGSYVTDKPDPGDVDVVTLVDGPTMDALSPGQQLLLSPLIEGATTKAAWGVDSYILPVYPTGHPNRLAARRMEGYWVHQWSQVRGRPSASKGFLEVT